MKNILILMMGLLVVASCSQKPKSSPDDDEEDEMEELKLKTYTFSEKEGIAHVDLSMDFPVRGEQELIDGIRQYIADLVGLESDEVELSDGQGLVDYYGEALMKEQKELAADYANDDYVTEIYHNCTFAKLCETDDFVTFKSEREIYSGGVHGINLFEGVTFFEDTGKRFTSSMLKNTDGAKFQQMMRDGLRKYFATDGQTMTDQELAEELINVEDVNHIPLPNSNPYITKEGIEFTYQPYEISYYAAGMPSFTIPLRKMKPFLSKSAIRELDLDDDDRDDED
ncbi:MAG: RsiV family protein [Prevotella sp.]|nr:RsiV family protein [Prevotella sp.]